MNKLTVVSGCPRSGTSICTLLLNSAIDKSQLIGHQFPQEIKHKTHLERIDEIQDPQVKAYFLNKYEMIKDKIIEPQRNDFKDLNPDGFWECRYTVNGIKFHQNFPDLTNKFCKIVSQGLAQSNPEYIGKIIYMVRDPRQVAKSQERLSRENTPEEGFIVHSPEMYINVNAIASQWILRNKKEDDVLIVHYDELVSNPKEVCERIETFLGFSKGQIDHTLVKPSLKRSEPEQINHHLFPCADEMYFFLKVGDFEKVINTRNKYKNELVKRQMSTPCTRLNENMAYEECVNCLHSKTMKNTLRKKAIAKGINWSVEPCMFLCQTNPEGPLVPLNDTIENNHWKVEAKFEPPTLSEKAKSAIDAVVDVMKRFKNKQEIFINDKILKFRKEVCKTCPYRIDNKCGQCGCNLAPKQKIKNQKCPLGKW